MLIEREPHLTEISRWTDLSCVEGLESAPKPYGGAVRIIGGEQGFDVNSHDVYHDDMEWLLCLVWPGGHSGRKAASCNGRCTAPQARRSSG